MNAIHSVVLILIAAGTTLAQQETSGEPLPASLAESENVSEATSAPDDAAKADDAAKERLKFMTKQALSFKGAIESDDETSDHAIRGLDKPLLRWRNVYSGIEDGILAGWVDKSGRPVAMAQIGLLPKRTDAWFIEMQSLSVEKFELNAEFNGPWRPRSPGVEWKSLASVWKKPIVPAKTKALRLAQMRSFAKRFQCDDDFDLKKNALRLLTTPLFRYEDPDQGILDGATFAMVHDTDPELVIMIEFREGQQTPGEFYYALAPMTSYELNVTLNGKAIWHKPKMVSNLETDTFWQRQLADSAPPQRGFLQRLLGL